MKGRCARRLQCEFRLAFDTGWKNPVISPGVTTGGHLEESNRGKSERTAERLAGTFWTGDDNVVRSGSRERPSVIAEISDFGAAPVLEFTLAMMQGPVLIMHEERHGTGRSGRPFTNACVESA